MAKTTKNTESNEQEAVVAEAAQAAPDQNSEGFGEVNQTVDASALAPESDGHAELLQKFYDGEFPSGYSIRFETRGGETVAVIEEV